MKALFAEIYLRTVLLCAITSKTRSFLAFCFTLAENIAKRGIS